MLRRPRVVLGFAVMLAALGAAGIPRVRFDTDLRSLVGVDLPAARVFFEIQDEGAASESLFLTVVAERAGDVDRAIEYAQRIRPLLEQHPEVRGVESAPSQRQVEAFEEFVVTHLFLLLDSEWLPAVLERLSPGGIDRSMSSARSMLESATPLAVRELLLTDPFGFREVLGEMDLDPGVRIRDGYLVSRNEDAILIVVEGRAPPTERDGARAFLAGIGQVFQEEPPPEGLSVELAGGYIFAEQDEGLVRGDLIRTIVPSVIAVALLFWVFFRSLRGLLVVALPVVLSLVVSVGALGWFGVRITPVAAAFCALLVGVGVDFGIHFLISLDVERQRGIGPREAVLRAVLGIRAGVVLGGLTTAIACASLTVLGVPGLSSLGVLLGLGIILSMTGALLFAPSVMLIWPSRSHGLGGRPFAALARILRPRARTLVITTAVLFVAGSGVMLIYGAPALHTDLRGLRPDDDPATLAARRLSERFTHLSFSDLVVFEGKDPEDGLRAMASARHHLELAGLVSHWSGPELLVPDSEQQERNIDLLRQVNVENFRSEALRAMLKYGLRPEPFLPAVDRVARALGARKPIPAAAILSDPVWPMARRFVTRRDGTLLFVAYLQAAGGEASYPQIRELLSDEAGSVVLTGPRAILRSIEEHVEGILPGMVLAVVVGILLVVFVGQRRGTSTFSAVMPAALGSLLTLAVMRVLGIEFDLLNIGLVPMILGLGVDDGIHLVSRHEQPGGGDLIETYRHVGGAVLLTTLTTCAAFGSLVLARSPGLATMGGLVICGSLSSCAVTLLLMPGWLKGRGVRSVPSS